MNLTHILETINDNVTVRQEDYYYHSNHLNRVVLPDIIEKLKTVCPEFRSFSKGFHLVGSNLDGLKVSKPDEYDINIILAFPANMQNIELAMANKKPGFITMNVEKILQEMSSQKKPEAQLMRKWVDGNNFLLKNKVSSWFQGIMDKAFNSNNDNYSRNGIPYTIKRRSNGGPAKTLYIECRDDVAGCKISYSIDLVVAFQFSDNKWLALQKVPLFNEPVCWYAVPRPDKSPFKCDERAWIGAYQKHEQRLLTDCYQLKEVLRLFKKLRDTQNINSLRSYHLKVIFLWTLQRKGKLFFSRNFSELFLTMFDVILGYLKDRKLPFYWHSGYNMWAHLTDSQIGDIHSKLAHWKSVIEKNSTNFEIIYKLFVASEESKTDYSALFNTFKGFNLNSGEKETETSNGVANRQGEGSSFGWMKLIGTAVIGVAVAASVINKENRNRR